MMKTITPIILMLFFLQGITTVSCNRKKNRVYIGKVLTRHQNPVADAKVSFYAIQTSAVNGKTTGGNTYGTRTEADGSFRGKFQMHRKEYVHRVYVSSDSGAATVYGGASPDKELIIVLE
jgi:hypothetical protein